MNKEIAISSFKKYIHIDDRGSIKQLTDDGVPFKIKRIYLVKPLKGIVRAFHGHKKEYKAFYVLKGVVKFNVVDIETDRLVYSKTLSNNETLYVPPGLYNGFVALTDNAEILGFSSFTVEESKKDDFRKPFDFIGKDIWESKSR